VAGINLAKRCLSKNEDSDLGTFLKRLVALLQKEQTNLKIMLGALGASQPVVKKVAAWGAEKVSRLKLNDSLLTYSDLGRLEELEMLVAGLQSQHGMWAILAASCNNYRKPLKVDLKEAENETGAMLEELKQYHLAAGSTALCN
jgi:hypothetical protein